ncbi:MAG TPA: hypothetical protein VK453_02145 [Micromonosporaceae bacterium]|nr:hypothetical protein [Micromonosporaceae bacterium]
MSLEQELREVLTDSARALPAWPDAVGRIQVGVRRRRTRRRAAVAVVALVGAVLVGIPAVAELRGGRAAPIGGPSGAPPTGGLSAAPPVGGLSAAVVPWLDTPADPPTDLARRSPRPDREPCAVADMVDNTWVERSQTPSGGPVLTVLMGGSMVPRCTLAGSAELTGVDITTGRRTRIPVTAGTSVDGGIKQYPATIDGGEAARIDIVGGCNDSGPTGYRDAALTVQGREIPLPDLKLTMDCRLSIGSWYVQPPLLNAPLTVQITAPDTTRAGTDLDYTVTVRNTFPRPYRLAPCPVYRQTFDGLASTFRLNCAIREIGAHSSATFAMRVRVPADAPAGPARLRWMAVLADGTVAIGDIATDGVVVQVER